MKKYIFLLFIVLSSHLDGNAQRHDSDRLLYVYSQVTNVRSQAREDAKIIDKLSVGQEVELLKFDNRLDTINGELGYWAKIEYSQNHKQHEGYIWQGNLTDYMAEKDGTKYLLRVNGSSSGEDEYSDNLYQSGQKVTYSLKAIKDGKLVGECHIDGYQSSSTFVMLDDENRLPSNETKLSGIEEIIKIYSSGEACAVPSYYYYVGWTGSRLLPIMSGWDAGDDSFSIAEQVVFPGNDVPRNTILKLYIDKEIGETEADTDEEIFVEVYKWNGTKAVLKPQKKSKTWSDKPINNDNMKLNKLKYYVENILPQLYSEISESHCQLLLDERKSEDFSNQWQRVYNEVESLKSENLTNLEDNAAIKEKAYNIVFRLIQNDDLATCVSDDMGLLSDALQLEVEDPWLDKLYRSYYKIDRFSKNNANDY
mgnify:FL=1